MSNIVSSIFSSVGGFFKEQAGNAFEGLKEGFMGSATPDDPNAPKKDKPWMEELAETLSGGAKNHWKEILGSILGVFAFNKTLGKLVPDGWASIISMVAVGALSFMLINNFTGAHDNGEKAVPVAKVDITTGPKQTIITPGDMHRDFSDLHPTLTLDHS